MRCIYFILSLLVVSSCTALTEEKLPEGKNIEITYNRTIETVMILRSISDTDYFLSRVADTSMARPMIYEARRCFKQYENHPAAIETERIFYDIGDIGGVMLQGVLYAEELPNYKIIYEPEDGYWKKNREVLENYMKLLADFYIEADVASFFEEHKTYYNGAIAEADSYVNDSVTALMENYFGKGYEAYKMYLLPMNPYGWGFSATTTGDNGTTQYGIISPVQDISWDGNLENMKEFGFAGAEANEHYRELVVHELVHPFVTNTIEQEIYRKQIELYDSLYTPLLDSLMQDNGYSGWWSFVNEHLVRLCHIRVAELTDKKEADELRKADIKEYGFVLMPQWEALIKEYEMNRDEYPTIDDYMPILIDEFYKVTKTRLDSLLQL